MNENIFTRIEMILRENGVVNSRIKGTLFSVAKDLKELLDKSDEWILTSDETPEENKVVETKIDDENGVRNETQLILRSGLWFFTDFSMYVYYTPTHWRNAR